MRPAPPPPAESAATALGAALLRLVRELAAAPTAPSEWVSLAIEAKRRGKSTSALRAWCLRHRVTIREESHRDAWVRPADIDRAIEAFPVATQSPSRALRSEDEEDAREAMRERDARRAR